MNAFPSCRNAGADRAAWIRHLQAVQLVDAVAEVVARLLRRTGTASTIESEALALPLGDSR
jgi:hypothetical protein